MLIGMMEVPPVLEPPLALLLPPAPGVFEPPTLFDPPPLLLEEPPLLGAAPRPKLGPDSTEGLQE
jgi:hypothetical protein